VGVWVNGVVLYNPDDARSYQNEGVWNQNAIVAEADGFDVALGHPSPNRDGGNCGGYVCGRYHHHQNPISLRNLLGDDGTAHSPLLGYAFDGFPIYGPYANLNSDGTGGVVRMVTAYRRRNITERHILPDGTVLPPHLWGPDVSPQYPLGFYVEDHEYRNGRGHLDEHNGRTTVTPDYPGGTYAYFVTISPNLNSVFPYILGPEYYGEVAADNFNQSVNIPDNAVCFTPTPATWSTYGEGFPGTNGEPTLTPDAPPVLGTTIGVELTNSSGQPALSVTFIGLDQIEIPGSWGGDLLVAPSLTILLALPAAGATFPGNIPGNLAFNGLDMFLQSLMADPGASRNLSSTKGLKLTLGL